MLRCRPAKWLWGLLPLTMVAAFALYGLHVQIERDLTDRTSTALQEAGLTWAYALFNGRNAVLKGLTFSRSSRDDALTVIRSVWGVIPSLFDHDPCANSCSLGKPPPVCHGESEFN